MLIRTGNTRPIGWMLICQDPMVKSWIWFDAGNIKLGKKVANIEKKERTIPFLTEMDKDEYTYIEIRYKI